ncbi:MAG: O-antigen ligase family protein [Bacteroidia bacterium]|nr:O-antigen ligase family protein [Bacteroidia bacterium]
MMPDNRRVYVFLVSLLFLGLPLGTVPTSIPQFLLSGYWLLTGRFKEKWAHLKNHREFFLWGSLWLWHAAGLLWTEDMAAGLNDLRIKIPMLLIPLLMGSFPSFNYREFKQIILFFITGLAINLFWSNLYMWRFSPPDPREASRFMSHIRLGFLAVSCIILLVYFYLNEKKHFIPFLILGLIIFYSIIHLGLLSAYAYLLLCVPVLLLWFLFHKNIPHSKLWAGLTLVGIAASCVYGLLFYNKTFKEKNIPYNKVQTAGNFIHHPEIHLIENGFNAGINIKPQELIGQWNRDFPDISIDTYHEKYFGLIRYLASKGLSKDSIGYSKLSSADKQNILNGISNYAYVEFSGIEKKLYDLFFSIRKWYYHQDATGSSAGMRFYYWRKGMELIRQNLFWGCGTGDVPAELKKIYMEENIPPEWMKRPHQQFISIWAALGIPGIALFLWAVFLPVFQSNYRHSLLFVLIWWGFLISFLYEDTLETQTGVSYVLFFLTLLTKLQFPHHSHTSENNLHKIN